MLTDVQVKEELYELNAERTSQAYFSALLTFGGELGKDEKGFYFSYTTTDYKLGIEFCEFLKRDYRYSPEMSINIDADKRRSRRFSVEVRGKVATQILVDLGKIKMNGDKISEVSLGVKKHISAKDSNLYARGVYLSCGSITRAESGYRLTLTFENESDCDNFYAFVTSLQVEMNKQEKDGKYYLVTRKGQALSDFLALIGASKSVLDLQDKLVMSVARSRILRAANLDAANADKSVSAAVKQLKDIMCIKKKTHFLDLSPELREVAEARINHPDATLPELVQFVPSHISKSGLYHRLQKLSEIAEELTKKDN